MPSDTPAGQVKLAMKQPMAGLLLGLLAGSVAAWVMLHDVLESEDVLQISVIRQFAYLIPMLIGASLGGLIELWKQGRTADIALFVRFFAGATAWVVLFFGSMYAGAWLGEWLLGSVGYGIGWFTGAGVFVAVQNWLRGRSFAGPRGHSSVL
jgi:hypothetical protein